MRDGGFSWRHVQPSIIAVNFREKPSSRHVLLHLLLPFYPFPASVCAFALVQPQAETGESDGCVARNLAVCLWIFTQCCSQGFQFSSTSVYDPNTRVNVTQTSSWVSISVNIRLGDGLKPLLHLQQLQRKVLKDKNILTLMVTWIRAGKPAQKSLGYFNKCGLEVSVLTCFWLTAWFTVKIQWEVWGSITGCTRKCFWASVMSRRALRRHSPLNLHKI